MHENAWKSLIKEIWGKKKNISSKFYEKIVEHSIFSL